jgi:ribosomal protein S11
VRHLPRTAGAGDGRLNPAAQDKLSPHTAQAASNAHWQDALKQMMENYHVRFGNGGGVGDIIPEV